MLKRLKEKISQFSRQGLFHIFGSSVFAKVGGIISSVVVVRNLPKTEYGSFVDADNLYAYLAIFIGLGFSTALEQRAKASFGPNVTWEFHGRVPNNQMFAWYR